MPEEKLRINAKQKKPLKDLASLFKDLGFTKISYAKENLSVERAKGQDLKGKPFIEYRADFLPDGVEFSFGVPANRSKTARLVELMPTFLDVLQLAEDYYEMKPSTIYADIITVFNEAAKIIGRDALEFSASLSELQEKHDDLNAKYHDLVRTSEANTRILLECEQKREELEKKISRLSGMSDDLLKESLFEWIKAHGGNIDVREFSKAHSVATVRAEEGLNQLIQEGYIRRVQR